MLETRRLVYILPVLHTAGRLLSKAVQRSRLLTAGTRIVAGHPDLVALLLILLAGAALRLAFFPRAPVFTHGDSFQYYPAAHALLAGDGFPLPLKRPPAYPVFIALVGRLLGEQLVTLVAVQHVLGVGTTLLVYGVGRLTFGRGAGLAGGLAAALSGGLLVIEHRVITESLFTFLLTLAVFLLLVGLRQHAAWAYVGGGLALGLASLTRPHAQVLVLLAPLVFAVCYRQWRPVLRATVLVMCGTALILVPWMGRNKLTHGTVAVAGSMGQNLVRLTASLHAGQYVFLDPAQPPSDSNPGRQQARRIVQQAADYNAKQPKSRILGLAMHQRVMRQLGLSAADADRLLAEVTLEAIRARPLTYGRHVAENLRLIFIGEPESLSRHWSTAKPGSKRREHPLASLMRAPTQLQEREFAGTERLVNIYQSSHLGLLVPVLFLLGLLAMVAVPSWRPGLLPAVTVLSLHLASAAVVGYSWRYHHPPSPLVHVVAFGGVLFLCRLMVQPLGWARQLLERRDPRPASAAVPPG